MVEIFIGLAKFLVELLNDIGGESSKKIFTILLICSLSLNVYLIDRIFSLAETIYLDITAETTEAITAINGEVVKIKKSE